MPQVYGFDPSWQGERDRMALAERQLDPISIRQLQAIGVAEGWRCLEVGAGAGSIAHWLAQRVGPGGRVLATDIDTRFVEALAGESEPVLETLRHDIAADPPLDAEFDLAHTRLVLQHLGARHHAIRRMAGALVPGGWLLVEELDFSSSGAASPLGKRAFARVERAIHRLLAQTGFDPECGRKLPALMRGAGLVDVEARGGLSIVTGGSPYAIWYGQSIMALASRLLAAGFVTQREVDHVVDLLGDPGFELMTPALVSARGRRPQA